MFSIYPANCIGIIGKCVTEWPRTHTAGLTGSRHTSLNVRAPNENRKRICMSHLFHFQFQLPSHCFAAAVYAIGRQIKIMYYLLWTWWRLTSTMMTIVVAVSGMVGILRFLCLTVSYRRHRRTKHPNQIIISEITVYGLIMMLLLLGRC